jgi:GNAT superfamily N-acetyltransferase
MRYFDNLGFGMFGWGDEDIGIFGGIRSGGFQRAGQFRCRFTVYDTAHRKATGEDMEIGTMELIVSQPDGESEPCEILELVRLEIDKPLRGMGYGRRAVEALMRAATDDVRISDIRKTKVGFWEAVGLESLSSKGGITYGYIRKEPEAVAAIMA